MTTFDLLHPREASGSGRFTHRPWSPPDDGLYAPPSPETTSYVVAVDGRPIARAKRLTRDLLDQAERALAEHGEEQVIISAESGDPDEHPHHRRVLVPPDGRVLIAEHDGAWFPVSELGDRDLTLFDVDVFDEPLVADFTDPEERVDLDSVREALTESPGDGPILIDAIRDGEDPNTVNVTVMETDNLLWRGEFTTAELDEQRGIVEDVYREWFGASINVPDDWDAFDVSLPATVPRAAATESVIIDRAYRAHANFRNQTDPGTFNARYIGHEIRRRIDEALQRGTAEGNTR